MRWFSLPLPQAGSVSFASIPLLQEIVKSFYTPDGGREFR